MTQDGNSTIIIAGVMKLSYGTRWTHGFIMDQYLADYYGLAVMVIVIYYCQRIVQDDLRLIAASALALVKEIPFTFLSSFDYDKNRIL